ncbi:hypothetical protein IAD21_05783 [Abditibacteriota bacterium]|nr:hypothetical protein IAD21_05783 [Abditibacteriota bacterium]
MKRINLALYGLAATTAIAGLLVGSATLPSSWAKPSALAKQPPFAADIASFEAADKKSPPPRGAVLFIGSSSIRYWTTVAQDFPEIPVINRGFGGSQIEDSVRYADRIVIPYKPKLIVFYAGGNDINAGKIPQQVLKDFRAFSNKVHKALPRTSIAFISINPSRARWNQEAKILKTNSLIEKYINDTNSKKRRLTYLDSHARLLGADGQPQDNLLRSDGLHLNTEGYKFWVSILRPQILTLASEAGVKRHNIQTGETLPQ